jgi:hypothetical protein
LDALSKDPNSPWSGVVHMSCTFHLVEQKFDNAVLKKRDKEGIFCQIKNWIRSLNNYFETENEYKLSYRLLIDFMNRPDVFE